MTPAHARNHPPGECEQCALEMLSSRRVFWHISSAADDTGSIQTALIRRLNMVASIDEVLELLKACQEHLTNLTAESIEMLNLAEIEEAKKESLKLSEDQTRKKEQQSPARAAGFVYLMVNRANGFCKIGFSRKPKFREKTLASQEPKIEILTMKPGTMGDEIQMHEKYKEQRIRGEWFNLSEIQIEDIKWEWEGAQ